MVHIHRNDDANAAWGKLAKAARRDGRAAQGFLVKALVDVIADPQIAVPAATAAIGAIDRYITGDPAVDEQAVRGAVFVLAAIDGRRASATVDRFAADRAEVERLAKLAATATDPQLRAGYLELATKAAERLPETARHLRGQAASLRKSAEAAGTPELVSSMRAAAELLASQADAISSDDPTIEAVDQGLLAEVIANVRKLLREVAADLKAVGEAAGIEVGTVLPEESATKAAGIGNPLATLTGLRSDFATVKARHAWFMEQPLPGGPVRMRTNQAYAAAVDLDLRLTKAARFIELSKSVTDPALADGYRQLAAAETAAADRARHGR